MRKMMMTALAMAAMMGAALAQTLPAYVPPSDLSDCPAAMAVKPKTDAMLAEAQANLLGDKCKSLALHDSVIRLTRESIQKCNVSKASRDDLDNELRLIAKVKEMAQCP